MGLVFVFLVALVFGVGVALLGGFFRLDVLENQSIGAYLKENHVWPDAHRWAGQSLIVASLIALLYQQALERVAGVVSSQSGTISCAALLVLVGSALCFTGLRVLRNVGSARQKALEDEVLGKTDEFSKTLQSTPVSRPTSARV